MKCPHCSASETKVIDSRINQTSDITRRRRQCLSCDGRFTTYERVEEVTPLVTKRDGRHEPYLRDKLTAGIQKACQKRPVAIERVEAVASRIEQKLQSFGLKEVPSTLIGQMVMTELHKLDEVAYVRFASVYRKFKDVDEFVTELKEIPEIKDEEFNLSFPFVLEPEPMKDQK